MLPLLAALVVGSTPATSTETVLTIVQRVPIAVVVNTPTGRAARTSRSELIRIVDDLLKRHTDFFPQLIDEAVVGECQGRLTCVVTTTRRDYKRESLLDASGEALPYATHRERLTERDIVVPEFLLMISNVAGGEKGDRVSILLVDTHRALEIFHETKRGSGFADDVEIQISEQAVLASPPLAVIRDASEAASFIGRVFDRHVAPAMAKTGHWEPYGTVIVDLNVDGVSIDIDGTPAGQFEGRRGRLTGVAPGVHTLTFRRSSYETRQVEVTVARRVSATLEVSLDEDLAVTGVRARSIVMYAGAALAIVGGVVVGYGISRHDGSVTSHCFVQDEPTCTASSSFESFGYDPSRIERTDEINPSGVLVVPLGASLVTAGAGASLSALLFGEPDEFPWIPIVVGVVLGGVTYGLSAAL